LRRELLSWMDCFRIGVFQRTSKLRSTIPFSWRKST
jgi:hypothetical protein